MSEFDKKKLILMIILLIFNISICVPIYITMYLPEKVYSDSIYSVEGSYDYDYRSPFVHGWGSDTFSFTMESTTTYFSVQFIPGSITIKEDIVTIILGGTRESGKLGTPLYFNIEYHSESSGYPTDTQVIATITVKHPNIPSFKYVVIVGVIAVIDLLLIKKIILKSPPNGTNRLQYKY